ncbi:DNA helicase-2/ATP-dependent DNA helicase PcrA [Nakamurella sp. UYEF19]|uniref:ATP-dependent helicase n=1 Tax=Nakamurella sp. UYEF19 TaxID=1756392 RepID=UPI00339A3014
MDINRSNLSEQQKSVVDSDDQAIVVLANAGSGKTEVVAQRVERLLKESAGDFKVLALSYTRRAANELQSRLSNRLGETRRSVETNTVHGFAHGLLLQYGTWIGLPAEPGVISDETDRIDLLQTWRQEQGLEPVENPLGLLNQLDLSRALGQAENDMMFQWASALADAGVLDYESMVGRARELLEESPGVRRLITRLYRHVIVDEAQNLTASQMAFLSALWGLDSSDLTTNVVLVGDDKQSIVGFAGASAEHLTNFVISHKATVYKLSQNFRSARAIAKVAERVAQELDDPPGRSQDFAAAGQVESHFYDDEESEALAVSDWVVTILNQGMPGSSIAPTESAKVLPKEIAVLARSAAALRRTADVLSQLGVQVSLASKATDWLGSELGTRAWAIGTFDSSSAVSRRRVSRILGTNLLSASDNPIDHLNVSNIQSEALRELSKSQTPTEFMEVIQSISINELGWSDDQRELELAWLAFCDTQPPANRGWAQFELFVTQWQAGTDSDPGVRLHTVHRAQGQEFKAVAIVGLNDGQFPDFRARSPESFKAELRAFYVAVTRPSRLLLLTRPRQVNTRVGVWARDESPFLSLIE